MIAFFIVLYLVGLIVLLFHVTLEVNTLEKSFDLLDTAIREHYGHGTGEKPDQ